MEFCRLTVFLLFLIAFPAQLNANDITFDKISVLEYIHSNSKDEKPYEYIYITGNPLVRDGGRSDGSISNVKEKFELATLYASRFRKPKDKATFLFFKELGDESYKGRMNEYEKTAKLKNHKFVWFSKKQEIFDYLTRQKEPGSIKGLFFFTHTFPNGINIGIKNPWGDLDVPIPPIEKKRRIIHDPQYMRAENFKKYMDKDKYIKMKNNFAPDIHILLAGCKPSVEKHVFRRAFYHDFNGIPLIPNYPESFIKWLRIYSLSHRISAALNIPVISTRHSTHFETLDENNGQYRWINKDEQIKPAFPLLMSPDKGFYETVYPDKRYLNSLEIRVVLKLIPLKPFTPEEKYREFYKNIKTRNKQKIIKLYEQRMNSYTEYMEKYNQDFLNMPLKDQKKYQMELQIRAKYLKELLDKERKFRLYKSISKEAIKWYRGHYSNKIVKERLNLGLPPIKIWFGTKLNKDPTYFFDNLYYYRWEKYTDFLYMQRWD